MRTVTRSLNGRSIGIAILFLAALTAGCQKESAGKQAGALADHHAAHSTGATTAQAKTTETEAVRINRTPPPGPAPAGMVWIPGGTFWMGCADCNMPDALPIHAVTVDRKSTRLN